ncbi:hypothetical protein AMATHDRAFT_168636, partial [Amanita thiersii Skay4041]
LSSAECNYKIYDKERLAIMTAFYEKPQNLNCHQAHWVLDLQEYDFIIKH